MKVKHHGFNTCSFSRRGNNAGAEVVDEQVVTDGNIITSRSPDDLPAFCDRILREFAKSPQSA